VSKTKTEWICFVAGQSAGHILPAQTIAKKRKEENPNLKTIFYSNHTPLDLKLLQNNPIVDQHYPLKLMQLPLRQFWKIPVFAWQLMCTFIQVLWQFKKIKPIEIISTGGLIAIPIALAGKLLGIPVFIYELNVIPGKATKLLARVANCIYICFDETAAYLPKKLCQLKPYPTRFQQTDYTLSKVTAKQMVCKTEKQLNQERRTVLVLGGSQGSQFINSFMHQITNLLNLNQFQIIHQTGQHDQNSIKQIYAEQNIPALVFSYESNLMPYYRAADLIICRAGAGTLAEVAPLDTPTICIPLETNYTDHQLNNARATAKKFRQIHVFRQADLMQDQNQFTEVIQLLQSLIFTTPESVPLLHQRDAQPDQSAN